MNKNYFNLTNILILTCVGVFVYETYLNFTSPTLLSSLFSTYGFSWSNIMAGKIWTFLTSIFLHGGADHLVLNMIGLFFFGRVIEEELGWKKTLLIFLGGALLGNFFVLFANAIGLMSATIPTIGASGAIFGLLGAAVFVKPLEFVFYPYLIPIPLVLIAVVYTIYNITAFILVSVTGGVTNIAYISHIGGILAGVLMGIKEEGHKSVWIVLLLIIIICSLPFIWNYIELLEQMNYLTIFMQVFK